MDDLESAMLERLIANWVYGGFLAGILLLLLAPIMTHSWPFALTIIYLSLPAYMIHQYEEHDNDRFRLFVNRRVFGGKEALTRRDVFLINVPGVWGLIGISLALAVQFSIGFGLIAIYLMLVNALAHVGQGIASRSYNPGLGTAAALFLPLSGIVIYFVQRSGSGLMAMHMLGVGVSLSVHAAILGLANSNAKKS